MQNLFEDPDAPYLVLVNDEEQRSLWPARIDIPSGWRVELPATGRRRCLDHIEHHWTDQRPRTLREPRPSAPCATDGGGGESGGRV
ncbi:MbtH family protein [Streptomyces sp. NPDC050560]|uniref:MbtH family protein n=1 Tax=Streptomyces sp. NPDC050560 TaxID=3365630 RepID=UPI003792B589